MFVKEKSLQSNMMKGLLIFNYRLSNRLEIWLFKEREYLLFGNFLQFCQTFSIRFIHRSVHEKTHQVHRPFQFGIEGPSYFCSVSFGSQNYFGIRSVFKRSFEIHFSFLSLVRNQFHNFLATCTCISRLEKLLERLLNLFN